jgi:hypothetical protein
MAYGFRDDAYFFLKRRLLLPQDPSGLPRKWVKNQKKKTAGRIGPAVVLHAGT